MSLLLEVYFFLTKCNYTLKNFYILTSNEQLLDNCNIASLIRKLIKRLPDDVISDPLIIYYALDKENAKNVSSESD